MSEKLHERARAGGLADVVLEYIGPLIQDEERRLLSEMKGHWRAGKHDPVTLASSVGALVALENFENRIRKTVASGRLAQKELSRDPSE